MLAIKYRFHIFFSNNTHMTIQSDERFMQLIIEHIFPLSIRLAVPLTPTLIHISL